MALKTLQPKTIQVTASGLTTVTTAYVTGDMLGTELTLTGAAAVSGDEGVIVGIEVQDSAGVVGALDLRFFSGASTPAADNAANSWSDANSRLQVAGVQVTAPVTSALNRISYTGNLWLPFKTSGSADLFLNVITLSGHTFFGAATDLQYTISILQWV